MTRGERETFPIRGHHLFDCQEFLLRGVTPARYSNDYIARLKIQDGPLPLFPEAAQYIDDVLGTTLSGEERFKKVQTEVLRTFRSLPNDTPVELTQTKDAICKGCAVGKHCSSRKQVKGDRACIYFLLRILII